MKKLTLFLFTALLSIQVFAQKGLPGYVVTEDGDTLKGTIKKSQFSDLRGSKFFGADGQKMKIVPGKIKALRIDREIYISASIKSLGIREDFKNNGHVFLKLLVKGEVRLYRTQYCYGGKSSAKRESGVFKERCPKVYYLKRDGEPYFEAYKHDPSVTFLKAKKQRKSDNQLAGYFEDYTELSKDIMYGKYERNMIDVIVKKYNDWKAEQ